MIHSGNHSCTPVEVWRVSVCAELAVLAQSLYTGQVDALVDVERVTAVNDHLLLLVVQQPNQIRV